MSFLREDVPLEDVFAILYVLLVLFLSYRCLCILEWALVLPVDLADQEDQLKYATQPDVYFFLGMAGVVLSEYKFSP